MQKNNKKIVYILSTETGCEIALQNGLFDRMVIELRELNKHIDITLLTIDSKNYSNELNIEHINLINTKYQKKPYLKYYYNIIKWLLINKKNIKLINFVGISLPIIPLVKILSRKKIILEFKYNWGYGVKKDYGGLKGFLAPIIQFLNIKFTDRFLVTTNTLKNLLVEKYKVNEKNIFLVPNFIVNNNYITFEDYYKKENIIIFAGRMHKSKGVDLLISAFKNLKLNNWKLYLVGNGEHIEDFKAQAKGNNNIYFTGNINNKDLINLIKKTKIFVLPSRNAEGHPKALIEALAAGNICIASNVIGNKDVIKDNYNGYLFQTNSLLDLQEKIKMAIELNKIDVKNVISSVEHLKLDNFIVNKLKIYENL